MPAATASPCSACTRFTRINTNPAIASNGGSLFLYASDFHNAKVDVFDTHFTKQASSPTASAG